MSNDIALVTGGSSGLGFEISRLLLESGQSTCIVGRTHDKLENAMTLLKRYAKAAQVPAFEANVSDQKQVEDLLGGYVKEKGFNVGAQLAHGRAHH